jgi:hypothetical protein
MKTKGLFVVLSILVLLQPVFAQQKVFQWLPANDESVRLDPANYHAGRIYHPAPEGGGMHIDVESKQPVTVAMARSDEWSQAMQRHEMLAGLNYICRQEHVVKATYTCQLPGEPMVLVIRDERNSLDRAVFAGMGAVLDPQSKVDRAIGAGVTTVLTGQGSATRRFVSPNDVHIQYYRWACVENCIQPEFQWIRQFKEKYNLTSFTKVYGGLQPERDGERVSVKIKSPVPMLVAILPSKVASQLNAKPDALDAALQQNSCQERGVQSLTFECTFNTGDGPQSVVVMPESGQSIPHNKKAEIDVFSMKCVANCTAAPSN